MKKNQDQPADAADLRRRAEAQLQRQTSKRGGPATELETVRLVHELEVHQIELEKQNEELQQSRAQVETLLARYTDLYDFAPTGYLTLDREGAIRQVNLTGAQMLSVERSRLVQRRFGQFVAESDRRAFNDFLQKAFASQTKECCEVTLPRAETDPLFVRVEAVVSEDRRECRATMLDVTARHQAGAELERLIQELQTALAKVKQLSGLLPICANCKKIRDDQGYWKQVETYITSHSEATFTHGLCPNCIPKFFPELDDIVPQPATTGLPVTLMLPGQL